MPEAKTQVSAFDSPFWINTLLHHKKNLKAICAEHFKKFDTDSNGQLEEGELQNVCKTVAIAMHVQEPDADNLHAAFLKFDRSKSGGLTASEFSSFFEHFLRMSLPLMVKPTGTPDGAPMPRTGLSTAAPAGVVATDGGGYNSASTSAPPVMTRSGDGIELVVRDMAGESLWGPSRIPSSTTVADLRHIVAETVQKPDPALLLLHGSCVLALDASLSGSGVEDSAELVATTASPEALVETALHALAECPVKVGHAKSPEGSYWVAHNLDRMQPVGGAGPGGWEFADWKAGGCRVVQDQIEMLAPAVQCCPSYRAVVEDLVLTVLDINISDQRRSSVGDWEESLAEEMYPDALTWAAAHSVPLVAHPSNRLNRIFVKWISRSQPRYFGDNSTNSLWTLCEMIKICPRMIYRAKDATYNDKKIAKLLVHAVSECMQWVDPSGCASPNDPRENANRPVIDAAYWALVEIGVNSASWDKVLKDPRCVQFLATYGLTAHNSTTPMEREEDPDDDDEWMQEYMYKRS